MPTKDKQTLLQHLEVFQKLLSEYAPSTETIEILKRTPLILMVGPTASGRNTLINLLVETGRYHYIVSDTTREPRTNNGVPETNGREYWFKSEAEFLQGIRDGAYLEAAIIHNQQVSGIGVAELSKASRLGKIAIDEIEPDGASHIHRYAPDKLFIFLLPPSFEIWMQRIRGRGDMNDDELVRRLTSATDEIRIALEESYYQFVINNEVHEAAEAVDKLANGRAPDADKQARGREFAKQLLVEVEQYLKSR